MVLIAKKDGYGIEDVGYGVEVRRWFSAGSVLPEGIDFDGGTEEKEVSNVLAYGGAMLPPETPLVTLEDVDPDNVVVEADNPDPPNSIEHVDSGEPEQGQPAVETGSTEPATPTPTSAPARSTRGSHKT